MEQNQQFCGHAETKVSRRRRRSTLVSNDKSSGQKVQFYSATVKESRGKQEPRLPPAHVCPSSWVVDGEGKSSDRVCENTAPAVSNLTCGSILVSLSLEMINDSYIAINILWILWICHHVIIVTWDFDMFTSQFSMDLTQTGHHRPRKTIIFTVHPCHNDIKSKWFVRGWCRSSVCSHPSSLLVLKWRLSSDFSLDFSYLLLRRQRKRKLKKHTHNVWLWCLWIILSPPSGVALMCERLQLPHVYTEIFCQGLFCKHHKQREEILRNI